MRPSIVRRTGGVQPHTRQLVTAPVCSVHLASSLHGVQQCRTPSCGLPSSQKRSSNVFAASAAGPQGSYGHQPAEDAPAAAAAVPPLPLAVRRVLFKDDAEHERDENKVIDYTEVGDDEHEELSEEELDAGFEQSAYDLKVSSCAGQARDVVMGTVTKVDDGGAYIDLGARGSAFMPTQEASFARLKTALEAVRPGMRREFLVMGDKDEFGHIIVSLRALERSAFFTRMRQMLKEEVTVQVVVEGARKHGLLVKYGPHKGLVPTSQLGPKLSAATMGKLVGTRLPVRFLKVDEEFEGLVFSNLRAVIAQGEAQLEGFVVGQVVTGVVQSVKPYGAFVDLGFVTGLIHVSQISHARVTSVDKVLKKGEKVQVMILATDCDRGRVTLSTKKLEGNPGDMLIDPQVVFEKAEEMAKTLRRAAASVWRQPAGGPMDGGR